MLRIVQVQPGQWGRKIMNESKYYRYEDQQNSAYFGPREAGVNVYDEVQWLF